MNRSLPKAAHLVTYFVTLSSSPEFYFSYLPQTRTGLLLISFLLRWDAFPKVLRGPGAIVLDTFPTFQVVVEALLLEPWYAGDAQDDMWG